MKPLTIELKKGTRLQRQFLGWKTPKVDDWRRQFYAVNKLGKRVVVVLKPAMPEFYDPNRQAKAVLTCDPFPEAVCVEISPCRLLAPPCYRSRAEFNSQLLTDLIFEPWKRVYCQTHREILTLQPKHYGPLKERLGKLLAAKRTAYQQEAAAWREKIKRVKTGSLQELGFGSEEQREKRLAELKGQLDNVESESQIDGVPSKGWLKLALKDVKRGHSRIRDDLLHEDWATENGEDLGTMARERRVFCKWLEGHTGTQARIDDATSRPGPVRQCIVPSRFGEKYEEDPRFLEACASVRFRARFADNAATVVYLGDCEVREKLTAEEIDESMKLLKGSEPPEPFLWHSEGFATISRYNGTSDEIETWHLTNEFRALCQLLDERPSQAAQYSEIEPQIGTRTNQLDVASGVTKPAQKGSRRVRDMLKTDTGQHLDQWGVLTVIKRGREKFLQLSPPKPA